MTIEQAQLTKSTVVLSLFGRLDTANAPMLERKIRQWEEIPELILDFAGLDYISSMGLRVLLQAKKALKEKNRQLVIKNMNESIREVFQMTGFLNLMVNEEKFVVIRKDEPDCVALFFNGQMEAENIPMVAQELSEIKKQKSPELLEHGQAEPVTVILDMKNLSFVSAHAAKLLKKAIAETAWEKRILEMRNVSVDLQPELN
ncbi:MAG: STAS domain-containing protein [Treponema sp.]|jgi:anti-sigma B factor antagonist|nr:STAS domain-containing protein [Treponema sp.]